MNPIPEAQMTPRAHDRLAAQRQIYADAKFLVGLQFLLGAPLAVLWGVALAFAPELRSVTVLTSLLIVVLNETIVVPQQKERQRIAAGIQELFDCDVLKLDWSTLRVGQPPPLEVVEGAARRFKANGKRYQKFFKDPWYPAAVGRLPLELARLVCQRTNMWWDADQRRRYAAALVATIVGLTVVCVLIGMIGGLTVAELFLGIIPPLVAGYAFAIRQFREHREAATRLDRLREHADRVWTRAVSGAADAGELNRESRALQDELFDHRKRNPAVFDWFYGLFRQENELKMNRVADELITEAKQVSSAA